MEISEMLAQTDQWKSRRNLLKDYGAILRGRRKERGITMLELSDRTGISIPDIEKTELGLLELSAEQKLRIKRFFRLRCIL